MHLPRRTSQATSVVAVTVALLAACSGGCAHSGPKADLYVAPDGSDAWSGALPAPNLTRTDGPLATLYRARDAVRELKARGPRRGPYVVMVRGGTYFLKEPLVLGPQDSGTPEAPVIYRACPGEEVTLSGGRPITGWKKGDGEVWTAKVPIDDVWHFRQLFVGGERQIRARTPNFDPEHPRTGGWFFVAPFEEPGAKKGRFGDTLVKIHTPGDTFQWKVDVPADGTYAVWFYYGAKNEPFGRKTMAGRTQIQVDEDKPVLLQNLADTAGWGAFVWAKTATLRLGKGEHRLRWTNVKGGGLNLDAIALCDASDYTPKGTKLAAPAGKHLIVIQAEAFERGTGKEFAVARARRGHHRDRFMFRPGDLRSWPRSPDPEIHIFPAWGWVNAILSVAKIDYAKRVVHVTNRNCAQELRPGNRYYVENVFEALDAPGEWFLDRTAGRLHYWPKDPAFAGGDVVAPALDRLIQLTGEHVVLRGFTFRHTTYSLEMPSVYSPDDGTIRLEGARHCAVEDCRFLGVGGYAVRLSDQANHNRIVGNTVADAGQGGVLVIGKETATQPKENLIAGNHIHDCGRIWKHVAGVYVTTGSGNRIAHNTITDVPRYGISLKTFGPGSASHHNVIEYNRILRTNLETNDTGAIETLGRDREDTGNVIRYNLILDAVGLKTSPTGEMLTPFYSWGIYLDDYSSGTLIYGNIVARNVRGGLHVHLGRNNVFLNNIFVDSENQQTEYNGHDFMADNVFARNIVYYHTGQLIRVNRWHDKVLAICENNLYWQVDADLTDPQASVTPKGSLAKWRQAGHDQTSIVADPLFVDPANDDYRLRPGSPALMLGFEPIDVDRIGVRGWRARSAAY